MDRVKRKKSGNDERIQFDKTKSQTKSQITRLAPARLFDEPYLIQGEDATSYQELLAQIRAAVHPIDIIDEMLVADVTSLEWEVLRWRRLKTTLIRARWLAALENFLREKLFAKRLMEILEQNVPEDQKDFVQALAHKCAQHKEQHKEEALKMVREILDEIGAISYDVLRDAQSAKAKELVKDYVRNEPDAVTLIDKLLADAGESQDVLTINALARGFDFIERLDRLTMVAEERRNTSLREIDRRRLVLGKALRQTVQQIEDDEVKMIEATPNIGKKVA
jgi:hypothetical protein